MKILKRCILLLIILLVILLIVLFIVANNDNEKINDDRIPEKREIVGDAGEVIENEKQKTEPVMDFIKFYTVKSCINIYLEALDETNPVYFGINEQNKYSKITDEHTINKKIYNLLDKDYIKDNSITYENIDKYINKLDKHVIFVPLKMNVLRASRTEKYAIYGFITDLEYKYIQDMYFIVNLDVSNKLFSIEPIKDNIYSDLDEINLVNKNKIIESNENNITSEAKINYEYIAKDYMNTLKIMMIANTKLAYKYLDTEYKEKKFGSYSEFEKYITQNKEYIRSINIKKYQVNDEENYREFILIDSSGRYYRFKENFIMDYTAMLDVYTIELPQFIEQYTKGNDTQKVKLNIEKFLQIINTNDYKTAYKLLNRTFKESNFQNIEKFQEFMKSNMYKYNKIISVEEINKENTYYICRVTVADGNNENNTKKMNFAILLGEGTNFEMSFNFN